MTTLILGWKPAFARLIAELDLKCVVVLGEEERAKFDPGPVPNCRLVHVKDPADAARVLSALRRAGHRSGDFKAVYADREQLMASAALVAHILQCRGMPVEASLVGRDKWLQKQAVRAVGVRIPEIELLSPEADERARTLRRFSYPALLKPVASSRSRYISVVRSAQEAIELTAAGPPKDSEDTEAFTVESFIDSPELHFDGLVQDGVVAFLSVGAYRVNILPARDHAAVGSILLDPRGHESLYADARRLTENSFRGMGLGDAAFHLEAFDTPEGLVFSECAIRTGGTFVPEVVQEKFGVDLRRGSIELALGRPLSQQPVVRPEAVGWTYLPAPPGRLLDWAAVAEVIERPGVARATVESPGSALAAGHSDRPRRLGLAVVTGANEDMVTRRIEELIAWFRSRVRTDDVRGDG